MGKLFLSARKGLVVKERGGSLSGKRGWKTSESGPVSGKT